MTNQRAFTPEQERDLVVRYEAGAFISELAEEAGRSPSAVKAALRRQGCSLRDKADASRRNLDKHRLDARSFTPEQECELVERYQAGAIVAELAEEMGTSRKAVNNALRRQGCTLRDKRDAIAHANARRRAKGEPHPNWRGGRVITGDGYVLVEINEQDAMWPMAKSRQGCGYGYILEHRLVMARALARQLKPVETVHHINGNRADNRIENLQLRHGRHGKGQVLVCRSCGSHDIAFETT